MVSGYELSRKWFDWSFENPEKISPNHSAIYFFAIEHCNRLGWREKFGFPTQMAMDAIGISKHQTFTKYLQDLIDWGFIKLIQKSKNQYSANVISLFSALPKKGKALDKAFMNHAAKQIESTWQSKHDSDGSIDKPTKPTKQVYRSFAHLEIGNDEVEKLRELYSIEAIDSILDDIQNFKGNTKYTSLYLTALKWLKKNKQEKPMINGVNVEEYEYFDSYASVWRNIQAFKNAYGYAPKDDTPKRLKK